MAAPQHKPSLFFRILGNFAVQRPFYILCAIIIYLPLTALDNLNLPGHSMLGNLFVDFRLGDGFWFAYALFGAVWAVMLTACLNLDGARDLDDRWTYNLPECERRVTIPMRHGSTFFFFTLLTLPGIFVVVKLAEQPFGTFVGILLGFTLAYLCMDIVAFLVRCSDRDFRALPWNPLPLWRFLRIDTFGFIPRRILQVSSWAARKIHLRKELFKESKPPLLKNDHFFALFSTLCMIMLYWTIYLTMKPNSATHLVDIEQLPPVAFIFALLLPLIWLISALWFYLRRYRIVLLSCIVYIILIYGVAEKSEYVQKYLGGPAHTFDVYKSDNSTLSAADVLKSLEKAPANEKRPTLIIVAASGGGILAAGWTSKVLSELHAAYPNFRHELRLISGVSGGSVGAAHYVSAHGSGTEPLPAEILREIVNNSMKTSLSITSYGLAFPDFRRAIFPIWTDEDFDRGRLAEDDWRQTANALRKKYDAKYPKQPAIVPTDDSVGSEANVKAPVLLSDWHQAISDGSKPAVIFNATVMETGRRVLFPPLSSVQSKWAGWDSGDKTLDPARYNSPQTYSEFIGASDTTSVDVWTGARLSATFSYVSPAARASFATLQNGKIQREAPKKGSSAFQHIIDGGYHDNSGVASALDWLAAAIGDKGADDLPFDRIALVEIRAKPFEPSKNSSSEWAAAWLGPVNGIFNSWDFAQTASYDTAVSRMIMSFQRYIGKKDRRIQLQSFVFVPKEKGPLSWHLSKKQKTFVCEAWLAERNKRVLAAFLGYVKNGDTQKPAVTPAPLDDCKAEPEK